MVDPKDIEIRRLRLIIQGLSERYDEKEEQYKKARGTLRDIHLSIKRNAGSRLKGYIESLQKSVMTLEDQYALVQGNFHKLNTKYNKELEKKQYIFPRKNPG